MKKSLFLIGGVVVLLGVICGNWTISENIEERYLIFSNIDALAETEASNNEPRCTESGYICVGKDKNGYFGTYIGLAAKQQ